MRGSNRRFGVILWMVQYSMRMCENIEKPDARSQNSSSNIHTWEFAAKKHASW